MRRKDLKEIIETEIASIEKENSKLNPEVITDAATICFNSGRISALEWVLLKLDNDKIEQALKRIPHLDHEEQEEEALQA